MNATQFIKDHGLERARHILSGLPAYYTHMTDDARMFVSEHNKDLEENIRKQLSNLIRLDELKRLVESVDIIKDLEGIKGAKGTLAELVKLDWDEFEHRWIDGWMCTKPRLTQAIKDHELIYGEGNA